MDEQPSVTRRQAQVLDLLVQDKSNKEIGSLLGISPHTVATYLSELRDKTGCRNRTELAIWWVANRGAFSQK